MFVISKLHKIVQLSPNIGHILLFFLKYIKSYFKLSLTELYTTLIKILFESINCKISGIRFIGNLEKRIFHFIITFHYIEYSIFKEYI